MYIFGQNGIPTLVMLTMWFGWVLSTILENNLTELNKAAELKYTQLHQFIYIQTT